jgi:hypothetical protein
MVLTTPSREEQKVIFQKQYCPQKRNVNQHDSVWSASSMAKEGTLYIIVRTVMLLCVLIGVLKLTIQGKINDIMSDAIYYLLPVGK